MKKKFVLYSKGMGYYTGKTYSCKKFDEDVLAYPCFTDKIEFSKKYSSIKNAEIFITSLSKKNGNKYDWEIREIE